MPNLLAFKSSQVLQGIQSIFSIRGSKSNANRNQLFGTYLASANPWATLRSSSRRLRDCWISLRRSKRSSVPRDARWGKGSSRSGMDARTSAKEDRRLTNAHAAAIPALCTRKAVQMVSCLWDGALGSVFL